MVQFRMTLRYNSTPNDLGDFTDWYCQNMPQGQKAINRVRLILGVYFLFTCLYFAWRHFPLVLILAVAAGGTVFLLNIPRLMMKNSRRHSIKVHSSEASAHLFGPKTVEIDEKGVLVVAKNSTSLYQWDSVIRIASTDTHAFLMVGPVQALIIPRESVTDGNFDDFLMEATRLKAESNAKQAVAIPAM